MDHRLARELNAMKTELDLQTNACLKPLQRSGLESQIQDTAPPHPPPPVSPQLKIDCGPHTFQGLSCRKFP